jgi:hydroxyethylthiazole kinase-like uncharacterized protein yjeF
MLPVYTSKEMQSCDAAATERYGIPSIVLMENAARGAVDRAEQLFGSVRGQWIVLLCGKGNNGGDGFAMARHLVNRGADVDVMTLGPDSAATGDALANLAIIRAMEKETRRLRIKLLSSSAQLSDALHRHPAWVADAMLGTGLSSPVKGEIAEIIEVLNSSSVPVLAVDIPTGIDAETGDVLGSAVQAEHTVTMGGLKRGLLLRGGREHAGIVHVVDISMPGEGFATEITTTFQLELSDVHRWLPRRSFDAHKYQLGNVFVLAGSIGLTGAAVMASESALRSGAGIVHLGIPASLNSILEMKLTEVMTIPFKETGEGSFSLNDYDAILERVNTSTVSIIGPGISRQYETQNLVRRLIEHATKPLVIDADALFALKGSLNILQETQAEVILTPHVGEFARLVVQSKEEIETKRIDIAQTFAVEFGVTLVLKGAPTVVATSDGQVYLNSTGNPGMATAGAGDVLSGIIAGFVAQGSPPVHAACSGVYLHGLAGDHAKQNVGEYGLIATDLIRSFAQVLKDVTPPASRRHF